MKDYKVVIEEKLERVVTEQAESEEEAIYNVEEKHNNCEIVLDDSDFKGYETRMYGELSKNNVFYTGYGPAILIEGNNKLGIIKLLSNYDEDKNFIVAENIKFVEKYENFEWEKAERFENILLAVEYFDELQENKLLDNYIGITKEIPGYRNLQLFESLVEDLFVGRNLSEVVNILHSKYELSNEEIKVITRCDDIDRYLDEEQEIKI